jgi:hypothetical protein
MTEILWVGYPNRKGWTAGRQRAVQVIILHYTAGSEGPRSAESGHAYDVTRTDGTSCGYFTDSLGPALQEVPDSDRSHGARFHGNEIGINVELCGTVQTRSQWLDPVSLATLRTTAGLCAILIARHSLAFRRLSTAELRRAYYTDRTLTGIVDHGQCTAAFPEDGGTHTDLGANFPWDVFMGMVAEALGNGAGGDGMEAFAITDGSGAAGVWYEPLRVYEMAQNGDQFEAWRRESGKPVLQISRAQFEAGRVGVAQAAIRALLAAAPPAPGPGGLVPHMHDGGPTGPAFATGGE